MIEDQRTKSDKRCLHESFEVPFFKNKQKNNESKTYHMDE